MQVKERGGAKTLHTDFLGGCQGGLQEEEGNKAGDDDKLVLLHGVREMKEIRNGGVEVGGEV